MSVLMIIGIFVGIVLVVLAIRFLFENFFISRILCLVCCLTAVFHAINGIAQDQIWNTILVTVLGWLFYRGEDAVDDEPIVDLNVLDNELLEPVSGLVGNAIVPTFVIALLYYAGMNYSLIHLLVPGIIILLDVISFFTRP